MSRHPLTWNCQCVQRIFLSSQSRHFTVSHVSTQVEINHSLCFFLACLFYSLSCGCQGVIIPGVRFLCVSCDFYHSVQELRTLPTNQNPFANISLITGVRVVKKGWWAASGCTSYSYTSVLLLDGALHVFFCFQPSYYEKKSASQNRD